MDADLTDDELRAELINLGQNPGPITDTTRKVWMKRLTALRAKVKKTTSKPAAPRKLVGLSSDESSQQSDIDEDVAGSSQRRQASPARGRAGKLSLSKSNTVSSRSTRTARSGSESSKSKPLFEVPKISPKKTRSLQNNKSKSKAPTIHLAECSESDGNSTAEEPIDEDTNGNHSFRFEPVSSSRKRKQQTSVPSYLQSTITGRRSLSDLRKGSGYLEVSHGNESLPFENVSLSSPPRSMLSMGINTTPSLEQSMGNSYLDSLNMSMGQSYLSEDASTPQKGDRSNHVNDGSKNSGDQLTAHGFKTKEDVKAYRYPQYISWGLLFSVTAIFIGIACIYLVNVAVHSKETSTNRKGQRALPANMTSTDRCIYSLLDHLSSVAGEAVCRSLPDGGQVSLQDAKTNAQGSSNYGTWTKCLEALLSKPEWGVRLLTEDGSDAQTPSGVAYLESTRPNMPFTCRLRRSFQKLLILTGVILAALVCVAVAVYVVRFFGKRKEDAQRQFYDLVEEIMDTLQQHVSACKQNRELKPYLAIPHVRDMLIPPEERQKKKKLWETAVAFLEANESRVRTESQVIMGEEFLVWRWLPSVSDTSAPTTTSSGRVWQGQAFADTKSVKPHYSPTECLKVRNMFDACVEFGEEWPVTIQDAILEKCFSSCPRAIHHIAVDKTSKEGCVYIKCESREAAGEVYKALHGWWFDGKLVTVKYLRAERYLERFPESSAFNRALAPSNNQMLSMAAHS